MSLRTVAALFTHPRYSAFTGMAGVECWGPVRDARTYPGPHPVVTYPPMAAWDPDAPEPTSDHGCFLSAIQALRTHGGILVHQDNSTALRDHGIDASGVLNWKWGPTGLSRSYMGTWVDLKHYGFPASNRVIVLAHRIPTSDLFPFIQGIGIDTRKRSHLDRDVRYLLPPEFARLLVELARHTV